MCTDGCHLFPHTRVKLKSSNILERESTNGCHKQQFTDQTHSSTCSAVAENEDLNVLINYLKYKGIHSLKMTPF